MRSAAKHVVSFLTVMIPIFHCQAEACVLPLQGKCAQSDYAVAENMVCPPAKASCSFSDGDQLCDYKQGCRDPTMTNWTVVNGVARAEQTHAGFCGQDYYYSVLESPWLEFTVTSCLKFRYKRATPAALDVFLALHNGSVITILNRTRNSEGTVTSHAWTVNTGIWKIKFRAYGASGPGRVEVHSVSWSPGRCESSGETPSDGSNRNATAPGNSGSTTEDCKLLTTTMTTAPPMPSTSKQNTASRSTSLVISSSGPSSSSSSVPVTRESSTSREKDGNKPSTTVIALSVVLSVVAVGLVVAVAVIVTLRRKINRQTPTADAVEPRELGPGFDLRETSGTEVTAITQDGDTTVPPNYDSLEDLSPPNDYMVIRDKTATVPAATGTSPCYYNVDNRQTTAYYNTKG